MKRIWLIIVVLLLVACQDQGEVNQKQVNYQVASSVSKQAHGTFVDNAIEETTEVIVGIDNLNVRKGASVNTEIVGQVHKGDTLEILDVFEDEEGDSWIMIDFEGQMFWTSKRFTYPSIYDMSDIYRLYDSPLASRELVALEKIDQVPSEAGLVSVEDDEIIIWHEHMYQGKKLYYPVIGDGQIKNMQAMRFLVEDQFVTINTAKQYEYISPVLYEKSSKLLHLMIGTDNVKKKYTINMITGDHTYAPYNKKVHVKVTVDVLNFRSAPGVTSEKLGRLYKDSVYKVLKSENLGDETWYQLSVGNTKGWVISDYCEETKDDTKDLLVSKTLDIQVEKGTTLSNDLFGLDDEILEVMNAQEVLDETYIFDQTNKLVLTLKCRDSLGREVSHTANVTVNTGNIACYAAIDSDEILFYIDSWSNRRDYSWIGHNRYGEDEMDNWYEGTKDGVTFFVKGRYLMPFVQTLYVYLDDGSVKKYEGKNLQVDTIGLKHGFYSFEERGGPPANPTDAVDYTIMIHRASGEERKMTKATSELHTLNGLLLYDRFDNMDYKTNKSSKVEIIDLASGSLETDYELDMVFNSYNHGNSGYGEKIVILGISQSQNEWDFVDTQPLKTRIELNKVEDQWTHKIISDDRNYKSDLDDFTLYDDVNGKSLGSYKVFNIKSIKFKRLLDIKDKHLVMWFDLELDNGLKGSTYRSRYDYEQKGIFADEPLYLITKNGKKQIDQSDYQYKRVFIKDAFAITGSYYYSDIGGPGSYKVLDYDGNERSAYFSDNHSLSPDDRYLASVVDGEAVEITIIDDMGLKTVYVLQVGDVLIKDLRWTSDDLLTFTISDLKDYPAQLKYKEGTWYFESDYVIKDDN